MDIRRFQKLSPAPDERKPACGGFFATLQTYFVQSFHCYFFAVAFDLRCFYSFNLTLVFGYIACMVA